MYLFRELFPNLINILGQFWRGIHRKYVVKTARLDARQMEYIVKGKANGGRSSTVISQELGMEDYEMRKIVRRHSSMVLMPSLCWVRCHLPQMMAPGSMGSVDQGHR